MYPPMRFLIGSTYLFCVQHVTPITFVWCWLHQIAACHLWWCLGWSVPYLGGASFETKMIASPWTCLCIVLLSDCISLTCVSLASPDRRPSHKPARNTQPPLPTATCTHFFHAGPCMIWASNYWFGCPGLVMILWLVMFLGLVVACFSGVVMFPGLVMTLVLVMFLGLITFLRLVMVHGVSWLGHVSWFGRGSWVGHASWSCHDSAVLGLLSFVLVGSHGSPTWSLSDSDRWSLHSSVLMHSLPINISLAKVPDLLSLCNAIWAAYAHKQSCFVTVYEHMYMLIKNDAL